MKIWHCPATVKNLLYAISVVRMPADATNVSYFENLRGTDYASYQALRAEVRSQKYEVRS